jgi:hypothetical protein
VAFLVAAFMLSLDVAAKPAGDGPVRANVLNVVLVFPNRHVHPAHFAVDQSHRTLIQQVVGSIFSPYPFFARVAPNFPFWTFVQLVTDEVLNGNGQSAFWARPCCCSGALHVVLSHFFSRDMLVAQFALYEFFSTFVLIMKILNRH